MYLPSLILDRYMQRCIALGLQGEGAVGKPYVGAMVISCLGELVGEGYRKFIEGTKYVMHAERMALDSAGEHARGGTLITTLEPCVRTRRNQLISSCGELILKRGIERVIYGFIDDSPTLHSGEGVSYLTENGLDVFRLNGFRKVIKEQLMP